MPQPAIPIRWIGTTKVNRDQGVFHAESHTTACGAPMVVAACGARPFAFAGSFPDGRVPGQKCQRCEAIVARSKR